MGLALAATLLTAGPTAAQPIPGLTTEQTMLVIAGVLLVVFSAIGAYLIYSGIKNRRTAKASETWPVTGGTVLDSDIATRVSRQRNRSTVTYYKPQIRYGYKGAGTEYEFRCDSFRRSREAAPLARRRVDGEISGGFDCRRTL